MTPARFHSLAPGRFSRLFSRSAVSLAFQPCLITRSRARPTLGCPWPRAEAAVQTATPISKRQGSAGRPAPGKGLAGVLAWSRQLHPPHHLDRRQGKPRPPICLAGDYAMFGQAKIVVGEPGNARKPAVGGLAGSWAIRWCVAFPPSHTVSRLAISRPTWLRRFRRQGVFGRQDPWARDVSSNLASMISCSASCCRALSRAAFESSSETRCGPFPKRMRPLSRVVSRVVV